jgi:hypothetical protein
LLHERRNFAHLLWGNVEQEFVMYLQDHLRPQLPLAQCRIQTNHCELDQVGCGPLQRSVDGSALSESAQICIAAQYVWDRTNAAEHRPHNLRTSSFLERAINKFPDALISLEVSFDVMTRLMLINPYALRR